MGPRLPERRGLDTYWRYPDEENNLLIAEKKRRGLNELWIGLKFDKAFGWHWSQYKRRATFNVFSDQFFGSWKADKRWLMELCAALDKKNEWNDWFCDRRETSTDKFGAICEMQ